MHRIFLSPPHMGDFELRFVEEAFQSNYIAPLGPMVDAFEREFSARVGLPYALAVSSGTAAMHLALRVLSVAPGDRVLASSLTFIGSVSPILFQGAVPVFIDSQANSWNMDPELLERELKQSQRQGNLPKAVVPTDIYGQCCDYSRILPICEKFGVPVVIDAAESLGAMWQDPSEASPGSPPSGLGWKHTGRGAKMVVFSFNGNKIITTSGGGMLVSEDSELIEKARFLSQQARGPSPYYEHKTIGYNYRLSNILAAIGRGQLLALDERIEKKRWIFQKYHETLRGVPGIEFMPEPAYSLGTRWLTVVLIDPHEFGTDRETLRQYLEKLNIESRPVWKPMHLQPVFNGSGNGTPFNRSLPAFKEVLSGPVRMVGGRVSETIFERGLCLPSGTNLSLQDMDRIVEGIIRLHKEVG